jgi:thymidylate kinase
MKEIDAAKIIQDLRRIADRVEERKPGYKEKCRREYQELLNDTSVFDWIDSVSKIEEVDKLPKK